MNLRPLVFCVMLAAPFSGLACHSQSGQSETGATTSALSHPSATSSAGPTPTAVESVMSAETQAPRIALETLASARTEISGCLALPAKAQQQTKQPTRAASSASDWRVSAIGKTIVVTHDLEHACCLTGETHASVTGDVLTITEVLSGSPCRCLCESTLRTRVPLAPGNYTVRLEVNFNGQVVKREVRMQRVSSGVTDLSPPSQ
jgi:hypothetical protein